MSNASTLFVSMLVACLVLLIEWLQIEVRCFKLPTVLRAVELCVLCFAPLRYQTVKSNGHNGTRGTDAAVQDHEPTSSQLLQPSVSPRELQLGHLGGSPSPTSAVVLDSGSRGDRSQSGHAGHTQRAALLNKGN